MSVLKNCPGCRNPELSIFLYGNFQDLTHEELETWLRGHTDIGFVHIIKRGDNAFAHVHFRTEDVVGRFYHLMNGKNLIGPEGRLLRFKAATYYNSTALVKYKLPTKMQTKLTFAATPLTNRDINVAGSSKSLNVNEAGQSTNKDSKDLNEAGSSLSKGDGKKPETQKRGDAESSSQGEGSLQRLQHSEVKSSVRQVCLDAEEVGYSQRKRRAEEYLDDHSNLRKEKVFYRIYEDSTAYTVLVHTSGIDKSGLVVAYCDCVLSLIWKFPEEEIFGIIVDDNIPEGLAVDIKLEKSIDSKSIVVDIENGVTKLILKKLGRVLILEGKGKENSFTRDCEGF